MDIESNVKKIIGDEIGDKIVKNLKKNGKILSQKSEKEIYNIVYSLCNYIDSNNLTYDDIDNIDLNQIKNIWSGFLKNYRKKYQSNSYIENNKIIIDYRINGLGYYWVDLEKLFSIDSMIRMNDCGRVNYGNTTFELRETTNEESLSHVIVVYNIEKRLILQIKGKSSQLPPKKYWGLIYHFILNFPEEINGYSPTYKSETDFKITYLPFEEQNSIFLRHPKLIF